MTREEARALVCGNPEAAVDLIVELVATVAALQARVAELERKIALLTRDSSNSSKPPSSDGLAAKPKARPPKKSKKRKRGGQPGHKGKNRDLIPVDEVDLVEEILPAVCEHCHKPLAAQREFRGRKILPLSGGRHSRGQAPRDRVSAPMHPVRCGAETWAELPRNVRSGFGPRLTAFAAYLTGVHRVTRRGLVDIFKTIFGIDISLGSVCNLHEEVSRALAPSYEEIKKALPQQKRGQRGRDRMEEHGPRHVVVDLRRSPSRFFHLISLSASTSTQRRLGRHLRGYPLFRPLLCLRQLPQGTAAGLLGSYHPRDQRNPPCVP